MTEIFNFDGHSQKRYFSSLIFVLWGLIYNIHLEPHVIKVLCFFLNIVQDTTLHLVEMVSKSPFAYASLFQADTDTFEVYWSDIL